MNFKGLFVGLTTIDIQYLVDSYPESNTKTKSNQFGITTGGPATNAAITFSFLGGQSDLWSAIGKNHFTNFIKKEFRDFKVNLTDINPDSELNPTISAIVTSENNGDRSIVYTAPVECGMPENLLNLISKNRFDIVLVDGMNMQACIPVAEHAKKKNIPVILDGGSWKEGMEILLPNISYAICAEDFFPPGLTSAEHLFEYLYSQDISYIAITRGGKPVQFGDKQILGEIPVESVNTIDTLGAGDIFHGAFCYYILKNNNFHIALLNAAKIASTSCKYFGTREWMERI